MKRSIREGVTLATTLAFRAFIVVSLLGGLWVLSGLTDSETSELGEGAVTLNLLKTVSVDHLMVNNATIYIEQAPDQSWYASVSLWITADESDATGSIVFMVPSTAEVVEEIPRDPSDLLLFGASSATPAHAEYELISSLFPQPRLVLAANHKLLFFDYDLAMHDVYVAGASVRLGVTPSLSVGHSWINVRAGGIGGYRSSSSNDPIMETLFPFDSPQERMRVFVRTAAGTEITRAIPAPTLQRTAREVQWDGDVSFDSEVKYVTAVDLDARRNLLRFGQVYTLLTGLAIGWMLSRPLRGD